MTSIGETLRQERLRRGMSLEEIAERTKIHGRFLGAIEAEDWEQLPGGFFARSFVRQYASFLGVDADELHEELAKLEPSPALPPAPPPEPPRFRVPPIVSNPKARRLALQRWAGSLAALVLVVLACAALYAVWQQARGKAASEHKPAPPAAAQARSVAASPAPAPGPPAAPIVIQVRASEPAWIRITSDGVVVFGGTMKPGQALAFHAQQNMSLLTGNAGGLEIGFNGRSLGPIGPRGHIRVVEFTPAAHQIVERKPPASESAPDGAAHGAAGA